MNCQWIKEHTFSISEGHAVFLQVTCGFCRVVLETHNSNICTICIYVKLGGFGGG